MRRDPGVKLHITPVITARNIRQMPGLVEYFSEKGASLQFSPYHRFIFHMRDELAEFNSADGGCGHRQADRDEGGRLPDRKFKGIPAAFQDIYV